MDNLNQALDETIDTKRKNQLIVDELVPKHAALLTHATDVARRHAEVNEPRWRDAAGRHYRTTAYPHPHYSTEDRTVSFQLVSDTATGSDRPDEASIWIHIEDRSNDSPVELSARKWVQLGEPVRYEQEGATMTLEGATYEPRKTRDIPAAVPPEHLDEIEAVIEFIDRAASAQALGGLSVDGAS